MQFIVSRGGNAADITDRPLRASDLPRPMTNAQADRSTRDVVHARQRALMRVSGFGDVTPSGDTVAADAGGVAVTQGMFSGGLQAIGMGVVTVVAATWAVRFLDGFLGGRR